MFHGYSLALSKVAHCSILTTYHMSLTQYKSLVRVGMSSTYYEIISSVQWMKTFFVKLALYSREYRFNVGYSLQVY